MLVVINIYSLMCGALCGKLHRPPSQLLFELQQSSIDSQIFVENQDLCLPHLHSTPSLAGGSPRPNIAMSFGLEKVKNYSTVKIMEDTLIHFDRIPERDKQTDGSTTDTV